MHRCQMDTLITFPTPMDIDHFQLTENFLIHRISSYKPRSKIPKSLINFFLVIQIIFGVNAGFSNIYEGKIRKCIEWASNLTSLAIILILISPVRIWYAEIWMWCAFFQYTTDSIVMRRIKYKLYDFLTDVHNVGEDIHSINRNFLGILIQAYTFGLFLLKVTFLSARCALGQSFYCKSVSLSYYIILNSAVFCTDSINGILFVILYYVYSYVVYMKQCLDSEFDTKAFENRYIAIVQCFYKIKPKFEYIIIIDLFINIPRLMVTLWSMLVYIKQNAEWYSYTSEWLFAFHLTIQLCIPCVIAEMLNCQMDSIKLLLNERLRVEKDREKSEELTRVLRYIKARRLQTEIWRVIPVDLRLPLALLSLCTTYFIVILQFTHLYG